MNSLILITAMSATTGLFGGGKHCGQPKHHARRAVSSCTSAAPAMSACGASYATPYASNQAMTVPSSQGYSMAPTKTAPMPMSVPPAPPAPTPTPTPTPTPSPSSSLAPTALPVVASGDLR